MMNIKTISIFLLMLVNLQSFAIEVDYGPDWQVKIDQLDSTVQEGKTTIKLTVYPIEANVEYKLMDEGKFKKMKRSDKTEFIILELDTGTYHFRISQQGYYAVEHYVVFMNQHYYEAQVNLRYPRKMQTRKPAIYLYGELGMNLSLQVHPIGEFNFIHPKMENQKWDVELGEAGKIKLDDKSFDYLFWEGQQDEIFIDRTSGFVVEDQNTILFLEEKLTALGLNDKEINDFIVYWGPELIKHEHNFIHFIVNEEYDQHIASLTASEPIETSIRIFMFHEPCDAYKVATPQALKAMSRKGLTLVEWGGGTYQKTKSKVN